MGGPLHLVQRGGAWAGRTNFILFDAALQLPLNTIQQCSADALPVRVNSYSVSRPSYNRRTGATCGCNKFGSVRASVGPSLKTVRFTSNKDQNISQWALCCPHYGQKFKVKEATMPMSVSGCNSTAKRLMLCYSSEIEKSKVKVKVKSVLVVIPLQIVRFTSMFLSDRLAAVES